MSGGPFRWALACCCIRAGTSWGAPAGDPATLELELARSRRPYLVLEVDRSRLSVRIRSVEVDAVEGVGLSFAWQGGGRRSAPVPDLPAVWRISTGPDDSWRRVIAPRVLVPYGAPADSAAPMSGPPMARPRRYVLETDAGVRLIVGEEAGELVPSAPLARLRRGWQRMVAGSRPPHPTALVAAFPGPDAVRLLHLFRPGTQVLVAGDAAPTWTLAAAGPVATPVP